ncbi:sugar ABC transporter ATP-binding protein [Lacrimispora sp. NSJ-141]|uniref:Sugar ABC transporter ATP-binding protein n=1 Tax=Lientehia hominis TaxID=2897778 RepID=A0AAP2RGM2_9FIRM|nr:sugar ABC transporter ATP-binding protein [Lientehia hominis]MCD2491641.1 sugar ABC transporter ATP-binding protein [Lientehia hominis]
MGEILRMEGISKSFPGVKALDNVNIVVNSGEVHALLGENGAGKSTLMKILNGVYTPDEGKIFVKGKEVSIHNIKEAQELGISIIFQEFNLCPDLTVADNVYIGRHKNRFGFVDAKYVEKETQKILDRFKLNMIKPGDVVMTMSVAQMQMVEICKAMSFDSEVVVFDEPTAALAESEIEQLFMVIKQLQKEGKGIIYISHRMEELSKIADRVTVLRDGQQVGDSFDFASVTLDELINRMVGRTMDDKYPKHERTIGEVFFEANHIRNKKVNVKHIDVRKGEILGIAGLMGAGRTETARAIFGADPVSSIEVKINGRKVGVGSPGQAIKNGIAYLTEDRKNEGLALRLDCEKNINMASMKKISKYGFVINKTAEENAKHYVDALAVKTPKLGQLAQFLSGGNQQKLVLAKWLSRQVDLLIFDEPTRGIDVGAKFEIYKLMNELSDQGVGIIMISSELPELLGMSDRIALMHEGSIVGEVEAKKTTQEEIMAYITGLKTNETECVGNE